MLRILSTAILFAASMVPPPAADVWTVTGDVMGYPINETCTLVTTSGNITGSCTTSGKTYPATGTMKGQTLTINHGGEYNGQALTLTLTGTIDAAGKLQGTIDVDPLAVSGTFTAVKSTSAPTPAN